MFATTVYGGVESAGGGELGVEGAGAGGAGLVAGPEPCGAGAGLAPPGLPGAFGIVGIVRLCFCASGITSGPFWPQPSAAPARQTSSNCCANFMMSSIPAQAAKSLAGTSVNGAQSNALSNSEVFMRLTRTLGALFLIAACGVSSAALADNPLNPLGFYVGAGVGESQIRSDDSYYGYPGYYNDNQFAWQGVIGIRPISVVGLEATYIDFGQPYRHRGYYDYNVSGSDSHPTAPALFAVGYLPIPIPFIDIFAKAGAARLATNLTDFVPQPCPQNGPCPYFVPTDRRKVTDTRFAYGAGVQSKFPFGLIVRGEYTRISSQYGDPDAFLVSAMFQF